MKDAAQAFLRACGATGPMRLRVDWPYDGPPEEVVLGQPFAVVGSTPGADVRLDASAVSKRQAYLQTIDGHIFCVPLDSHTTLLKANPTGLGGWMDEEQALRLGPDRVGLLSVEGATPLPPPSDPLASGSSTHLPLPSITLEFRQGHHRQSHWRMDRRLALVGRAAACKVRLDHARVSRVHCSLLLTPEGPWLIDLVGGGGVRVNGRRVRFCRLGDGDEIELSVFRIQCHYDSPAPGHVIPFGPTRPGTALAPVGEPFDPTLPPPLPPLHPLAPLESGHDSALVLRSLVGPLVEQFNQMQSQLFDQFQQAMLQMFHIFSAVQNDQMNFIREELNRLRDLTQELHGLQVQLAQSGRAEPTAPARERTRRPVTAVAPPDMAAQPPLLTPASGNGATSPPTNGKPRPQPAESGAAKARDDETDLHALLCQRVEKLQQERQGRWQRLLDCLFGKRSGEGVP